MIIIITENNKRVVRCVDVFVDDDNRLIGTNTLGQDIVLGEYAETWQAQGVLLLIANAIANGIHIFTMSNKKHFPDAYFSEEIDPFGVIENIASMMVDKNFFL